MKDKVVTIDQAMEKLHDGMTIMVPGFVNCGVPQTLIQNIMNRGIKDLNIISNNTSVKGKGIGKLVHAGAIKHITCSHIGNNVETVEKVVNGGATTGTSVTLNHNNGIKTVYAFLSRSSVRVGDHVRRGDIIAFTGNSGLSYAPHLHYEVRKDDRDVNPIDYLFLEIGPDKVDEFREIVSHAMQAFD